MFMSYEFSFLFNRKQLCSMVDWERVTLMGAQCWTLNGNNWLDDNIHLVQGNWIVERTDWRGNKTAGWAMDRENYRAGWMTSLT